MKECIVNNMDVECHIFNLLGQWYVNTNVHADSILMHPSVFFPFCIYLNNFSADTVTVNGKIFYKNMQVMSVPQLDEFEIRIAKTKP